MPDHQLIDGLVETYRTLNLTVRSTSEDRLRAQLNASAPSVRDVVRRMRDDELRFSQALKARITGIAMPDIFAGSAAAADSAGQDATTAVLIAQFGTARESTLAMIRGLPDVEWDEQPDGEKPIRARLAELVENDRMQLERIGSTLGSS